MIIAILDNEHRCSDCWAVIDPLQELCDQCLDKIGEEQNCFDSEHEVNEIFQYRSQLI